MTTAPSPKMTEKAAIRAIMRERWRRTFCLPNYEPKDWWECDIFEITKAGYMREFEIKLTLADFRHDREKSRDIRKTGRWVEAADGNPYSRRYVCDQERKHDLLARGDERGPVQFYYVTPVGLVPHAELPEWAGLIELEGGVFGTQIRGEVNYETRVFDREVVEAPHLHKAKTSKVVEEHARGVCYWRLIPFVMGESA